MAFSVPRSGAPVLVERDAELDALYDAVREAARHEGSVVLVQGPAGAGKTALLRAGREYARAEGLSVLAATGSELDRSFAFGLVHQLLDGVLAGADAQRRERLLAGAASLAGLVLDPSSTRPEDPSHAALQGLYWLCANLAEEEPLVLVVDDLHWGDAASLRFLEFLGRRLEGLALLVLGAVRSGEPGAENELLAALAAGPAARVLRPAALSEEGTGQVLADALGHAPDAAFMGASREATGGNPLLLRVVARAAAEQESDGRSLDVDRVAALGATGARTLSQRRVAALGADAAAVARAATLLGERPRLDDLASLTGLPEATVATAVDRLVEAEVLDGPTRGFVHPVLREALAATQPASERGRMHALVARREAERGARPGAVAAHLLATEPAGDPWVVGALREAARVAVAKGAPGTAITHLRRALAEPPAADERPVVLLELGELELAAGDPQGTARLATALDAGLGGDEAARARAGRARSLLLSDPPAAMAELVAGRERVRSGELDVRLEALALEATFYDASLAGDRAALLAAGQAGGAPSPAVLAHLAVDAAYGARPPRDVVEPAQRALGDDALVRALGPASATVHLLALALRHAEQPALAAGLLDAAQAAARRLGSRLGLYYVNHARAYWHLAYGSVASAEAHARDALEVARDTGAPPAIAAAIAILAEVLIERGAREEAATLLEAISLPPALEGFVAAPDVLSARAVVRLHQRRREEAETDLRRAHELLTRRGWRVPLKGRVGLRLAAVLAERGEREEALALVDAEEEAARGREQHGTLGLVLATRARVLRDERAEETRASAEVELRASELRLDLARVRFEQGAALRRAGQRAAAREPLREAVDVAGRLGAEALAELAREELIAAGARPRREALSGPESLTPSERRVAELAAQGLSNREVAETLWVTRKTVEVHLGNAYGKLGIRSRSQLAGALGEGT